MIPAFSRGDLLQAVAENVHMIFADMGDAADRRQQDIGTVQASAHAHFHHRPFDSGLRKIKKGKDHDAAKNRQIRGRFKVGQGAFDQSGALLPSDQLPVYAHPFAEGMQVGAGEQTGAVAQMAEDRLCVGAGAALALCAGHVNRLKTILGIIQRRQKLRAIAPVGLPDRSSGGRARQTWHRERECLWRLHKTAFLLR